MSDHRDPEKDRAEDGEPADEEAVPRRPRSVRDAPGPAASRPGTRRPARSLRSAREGAPASGRGKGDDEKRPVPVRAAMGVSREDAPPLEAPTRTVRLGEGEGEVWVVRVEGRTTTGQPPDAGAPLLFLSFATEEDPEHPVREAMAVGRSLEALSEAQLEALLAGARPVPSSHGHEEIFPGTRRPRGGGR